MKNTQNIIKRLSKTKGALGFFLGGSSSSRLADKFSDKDYGLILNDAKEIEEVILSLREDLGEIHEEVEKEMSRAFHFITDQGRIEIRIVVFSSIQETLGKLKRGENLVYCEQDLLENVRRGIYFHETDQITKIKKEIVYPESLKKIIIERYLPLLDADEIQVPTLRGDKFLMMHYLVDLQRAALVLAHAQVQKFTTSFKHEKKLMRDFSENARMFFENLNSMFSQPSKETYDIFSTSLTKFKEELYHEINDIA